MDSGGFKRLRQRFAGGRGADRKTAAAVMLDVAGAGHAAADIDRRRYHRVADDGGKTLRIVDAVLQAENGGFRPQSPRQRPAGGFGIGRFHADQHQVGRGEGGGVGRGLRRQVSLEPRHIQQQAMGVDGVDMRLPADEGHVMPGAQQQAAIVASDRSGADDRDLHAWLLDCVHVFAIADASGCRNSAGRFFPLDTHLPHCPNSAQTEEPPDADHRFPGPWL